MPHRPCQSRVCIFSPGQEQSAAYSLFQAVEPRLACEHNLRRYSPTYTVGEFVGLASDYTRGAEPPSPQRYLASTPLRFISSAMYIDRESTPMSVLSNLTRDAPVHERKSWD
jgi:hypothetical protein